VFTDRDRSRSGTYHLESLGMLKNYLCFSSTLATILRSQGVSAQPSRRNSEKLWTAGEGPKKVGVVSNIFRG